MFFFLFQAWSEEKFYTLFECYESRPLLWRKSDSDYMNKDKRADALKEIGVTLNCSTEIAEAAWKAMRDNFTKEVKLMNPNKSGSGRQKKKPWRFYNAMQFLF